MVQSKAKTVTEYLAELPEERRKALQVLRKLIKANTDSGIEERMSYGMIGYHVPLRIYPDGYHCDPTMPLPYAALASQARHLSVYMMGLYSDRDDAAWFQRAWRAAGHRLDMGKSCVRFRSLDDVPLDVLAEAFRRMPSQRYIAVYEAALAGGSNGRPASRKAAAKKVAKK